MLVIKDNQIPQISVGSSLRIVPELTILPEPPTIRFTNGLIVGPTAQDYRQADPREHVYSISTDMYVGPDERIPREAWLFDIETLKARYATIYTPQAVERIFLEILANAADNVNRSRRMKVDPGRLEIFMTNKTITITNYGVPIPIELNDKGIYVPEMIFGSMLTSSNYTEEKHEIGKNGIGAKACNIFSHKFTVKVLDAIRHKSYTQVWESNMKICGVPQIDPYDGLSSAVTISYQMDFTRFRYFEAVEEKPITDNEGGGYLLDELALFARHAADTSFNSKIPVVFNGVTLSYFDPRIYFSLYVGEEAVKNAILHYEWPAGTVIKNHKGGVQTSEDPCIMPLVEMVAADTPDMGINISFVNSLMTLHGGVHVTEGIKAVTDEVVKKVNQSMEKKEKGGKKKEGKKLPRVNVADVRPHISLMINIRVVNPKFESQSKTRLENPKPKITLTEAELKHTNYWKLMDRLYAALDAKQFNEMKKTDGRKKKYVNVENCENANLAGTARSMECSLFITEGLSGSGYITFMLSFIPKARDTIGIFPIRGKGLNVMNASKIAIALNKEIEKLKEVLGLREGLDYRDPSNLNSLRYGKIIIAADSDNDGKHITALTMNYFHCCHPTLLAVGALYFMRTPILRTHLGSQVHKFYTQKEYDTWCETTPNRHSYKTDYFKGLGTSSKEQVGDDMSNPRFVQCFYDADSPGTIELAFHKDKSDDRKNWITCWHENERIIRLQGLNPEEMNPQPISLYINHEFILFSRADLARSLPHFMDGLKEVLRKILFFAHKEFNIGNLGKSYTKMKVNQFGNAAANATNYSHGEDNMCKAIVRAGQDFVGANNLPYYTKNGCFGTRSKGGKDAANPRYLHTTPEWWIPYVIRKEDTPILEYTEDEGKTYEPSTYYPIIPMGLVNGESGIATGWATFAPGHHPLDVLTWIKNKLCGQPTPGFIKPWYRGFNGSIIITDRRKGVKFGLAPHEEIEDSVGFEGQEGKEGEVIPVRNKAKISMVTMGKFQVLAPNRIMVTELPIGKYMNSYNDWILQQIKDKKIADYNRFDDDVEVRFEIIGMKDNPSFKNLGLMRSYGISNMVFLDSHGNPVKFHTSVEYLESWFTERLPIYEKRRLHIISDLEKKIQNLNCKMQFIAAVVEKRLHVMNRNKAHVIADMVTMNIPGEIYKLVKISHCSVESIRKLAAEIGKHIETIAHYQNISPQQMWLNDLLEFEAAYRKIYPQDAASF